MSAPLRWSPQTQRVFAVFMHAPNDWQYGYDISRNTGLKSGTLYHAAFGGVKG